MARAPGTSRTCSPAGTDVDLTAQGREEARAAGTLLRAQGFEFRQSFTSVLKRAIRTLWIVLDEMDRMWVPVERDWRLNERHYGALQGLDKAETTAKYGADQVKVWRRSYDIPPPPLAADDPRHPRFDARYAGIDVGAAAGDRVAQGHARARRALVARAARARARVPVATCSSSRTATACARSSRCSTA